jgi:16S rRNA (guanine527-N7)-methyltransferase
LQTLIAAAERLGLSLDASQQALFRRYFELLEEGGQTASLTAAKGWERVREELFIRSLRLLSPVAGGHVPASGWFSPPAGPEWGAPAGQDAPVRHVLDVGAGAGVPGLVLKIALPHIQVTLLDAAEKKCEFLRRAVRALSLTGVAVLQARAEEAAHSPPHREAYDVVVARALARLAELAELTLPFAKVGGVVIAQKGQEVGAELSEAGFAARELGAAPAITQALSSPGNAPPDTLVYWLKIGRTPARYPRRTGIPHKRPLVEAVRTAGATA